MNGHGNNAFVGAFSAVNESTWEHLKLAFFPMLFITILGLLKNNVNTPKYLCARTLGIITAVLFITVFFYTYTGILGTNIAVIDIASFVIAILLGEFVVYKVIEGNMHCNKQLAIIVLIILFLAFILFTYFPPKIQYFIDPITNKYGLNVEIL